MNNLTLENIIRVGDNYPDNVLLEAVKSKVTGKYYGIIKVKKKDSEEYDTVLNTYPKFKDKKEALIYVSDLSKYCRDYSKNNEVFG